VRWRERARLLAIRARTGVTANESLRTLPPDEVTFAEHLRSGCQQGSTPSTGVCYTTGMMGKWHNGWNAKAPWKQGFEEFVGFERSQSSISLGKWRCFPAQLTNLMHTPNEPEQSRFGPGLLRLDPQQSDEDICRSINSKDNDGELIVPAYAACEDPDTDGQATCGGGSLRCGGPEDCPFYGCLGRCSGNVNVRCMTDGNCAPSNGTCQDYDLCTARATSPRSPGSTCGATMKPVATILSEDARH
jgi:hypothetical protein